MVTIKLDTEKTDKGMLLLLPTIAVDYSEIAAKARIAIGFMWLCGMLTIGIKWTRKEKITAIKNKNE